MILIAHRGLVFGPNKELENSLTTIDNALDLNYDVEVDVWYVDGKWHTGHDEPQYEVSINYLFERRDHLWIHTKNEDAFIQLQSHVSIFNFFWHDTDTYTITSQGVPWIYPGKKLMQSGICVMPELHHDLMNIKNLDCLGICSDYVADIETKMGDLYT